MQEFLKPIFKKGLKNLKQVYQKAYYPSIVTGQRLSWAERQAELQQLKTGQIVPKPNWMQKDWTLYQRALNGDPWLHKPQYYLDCLVGDVQNMDLAMNMNNALHKAGFIDYYVIHPASDQSGILVKAYDTKQDKFSGDIIVICNPEKHLEGIDLKVATQELGYYPLKRITFPGFTPYYGAVMMGGSITQKCSQSIGNIQDSSQEYTLVQPYQNYTRSYSFISISLNLEYGIWFPSDGIQKSFDYYLSEKNISNLEEWKQDKEKNPPKYIRYHNQLTAKERYLPTQAFCEYLPQDQYIRIF